MDKQAVIRQLADEWCKEPVREDELTVTDFIEAAKPRPLSRDVVRNALVKLVRNGVLEVREAKMVGAAGTCNAYSLTEGKSWEDVLQYIK